MGALTLREVKQLALNHPGHKYLIVWGSILRDIIRNKDISQLVKSNRQNKPQLVQLFEFWLDIMKSGSKIILFFFLGTVLILAWVSWRIALVSPQ